MLISLYFRVWVNFAAYFSQEESDIQPFSVIAKSSIAFLLLVWVLGLSDFSIKISQGNVMGSCRVFAAAVHKILTSLRALTPTEDMTPARDIDSVSSYTKGNWKSLLHVWSVLFFGLKYRIKHFLSSLSLLAELTSWTALGYIHFCAIVLYSLRL